MDKNKTLWIAIRRSLIMIIAAFDKHFGVEPPKNLNDV